MILFFALDFHLHFYILHPTWNIAHTWLFIADTCSHKTLETYSVIFPSTYWLKLLLPLDNMTVYTRVTCTFCQSYFIISFKDSIPCPQWFQLQLLSGFASLQFGAACLLFFLQAVGLTSWCSLHRFPIKNAPTICRECTQNSGSIALVPIDRTCIITVRKDNYYLLNEIKVKAPKKKNKILDIWRGLDPSLHCFLIDISSLNCLLLFLFVGNYWSTVRNWNPP